MSSRTSSRSTLTMVPSTMSPSLKYLIVASMGARKSSADPMSLIATCVGAGRVGASVVLVVKGLAPDRWVVRTGLPRTGSKRRAGKNCRNRRDDHKWVHSVRDTQTLVRGRVYGTRSRDGQRLW